MGSDFIYLNSDESIKLRYILCTHAFHRTDSKGPDIHVPDG